MLTELCTLPSDADVQLSPAAAALRVENAKLVCVRGLSQEHGQSTRLLLHHAQSLGVDARFELSEMMQAVASDIVSDRVIGTPFFVLTILVRGASLKWRNSCPVA